MVGQDDLETGARSKPYSSDNIGSEPSERETLLPTSSTDVGEKPPARVTCSQSQIRSVPLIAAFLFGALACFAFQFAVFGGACWQGRGTYRNIVNNEVDALASPNAGSTQVDHFPPTSPTNVFPSFFPSNIGYSGGTPTGAEPAVIATAPSYPIHSGAAQLLVPETLGQTKGSGGKGSNGFNLFEKWGNLSPWYSVKRGRFGVDSGPETPDTCVITGLHFLHRHGARYPTKWASYGGPASFATCLHENAESWNASGDLEFLNDWTYKLGEELLTPFGRQQLFDLGVSLRLKYGFLLKNFTESNTIPVFRTESQDRMLASAMNFAIGFFGYPFDGQYQQSITIEADGFNNTLAPYKTCPNAADKSKGNRGTWYVREWSNNYLKDARERLQRQLIGFNLTIEDVYTMQQLCAYETVAIGYSKFCELFTVEEWDGFNYSLDLMFWYNSAFGSPVARVQGIGYVQELLARLTHTPIQVHNSSTNSTLDDSDITFPLGQSLYVDATHEVVVLNILTALNLTGFAESGSLPYTHIPHNRSFRVAEIAPFATNVQFQLLACTSLPGPQIRIVVNDGVVPLTGIRGCPSQRDGMCPVEQFVEAQRETIRRTDWVHDCHGDWTVPEGPAWETVTGDSPKDS